MDEPVLKAKRLFTIGRMEMAEEKLEKALRILEEMGDSKDVVFVRMYVRDALDMIRQEKKFSEMAVRKEAEEIAKEMKF